MQTTKGGQMLETTAAATQTGAPVMRSKAADRGPALPEPRGEISQWVIDHLHDPHSTSPRPVVLDNTLDDEDATLALYVLYELSYRGFAGVADDREADLALLAMRGELEAAFTANLVEAVDAPQGVDPREVPVLLRELLDTPSDAPSISAKCESSGTHRQLREQAILRAAYQQKEADAHSWLLPRLDGEAKAHVVRIQYDEYGEGRRKDIHAELFNLHLERLGLDASYGAWSDHIPGVALAGVNLASMFGIHRRWRGAAIGHLTHFEMSSVPVMAAVSTALGRLGYDSWTRLFYDVHVVADAEHQTLAADHLVPALLADEPHLADDVLFGAHALQALERRLASHTVGAWQQGRTALRRELDQPDHVPGLEPHPPATDPR